MFSDLKQDRKSYLAFAYFFGDTGIGDRDLYLELIADGIHVCPPAIKFLTDVIEKMHKKNWADVVMLITDAINIIAPSEKDQETGHEIKRIGDKTIYYIDGAPYLDKEKKTLYGSTLTMIDAIKNMTSWNYNLVDVIKSAALTPAIAHYINDKKGSIEKGKDADIVILDEDYKVKCSLVRGSIGYISSDFQV